MISFNAIHIRRATMGFFLFEFFLLVLIRIWLTEFFGASMTRIVAKFSLRASLSKVRRFLWRVCCQRCQLYQWLIYIKNHKLISLRSTSYGPLGLDHDVNFFDIQPML